MRHWRVNIVFGPNTRWNDNSGVQTKVKPSFIWSFFCLLICYFCSLILCVIIIVIFIYWFVLTIINSWGWPLWQSWIQRLLLYLYYIRYTFIVIYCYFLTTYGKAWWSGDPVIRSLTENKFLRQWRTNLRKNTQKLGRTTHKTFFVCLDTKTEKILTYSLLTKEEATSSSNMEPEEIFIASYICG
jgi:hypothetical protein